MEDMYLKIGDIAGEATGVLAEHIRVVAWSFLTTQSATMHDSTGGTSAAAKVGDLLVTKYVDSASANLFKACASGAHYDDATLTVRKAGGDEAVDYLQIVMEKVLLSHYEVGVGTADNERILETIKINCERIKIVYAPQGDPGTPGATIEGGWNMRDRAVWA